MGYVKMHGFMATSFMILEIGGGGEEEGVGFQSQSYLGFHLS